MRPQRLLPIAICGCIAWFGFNAAECDGLSAVESPAVIALQPVVSDGLSHPLYVTHAGDGSGRLFVLEQPGRIRIIRDGSLLSEPFLDITTRVGYGGERGLLGLAFHPDYRRNGRYFVNYTRESDGGTVIAEYRTSQDPDRSETAERQLLVVPQPYGNHNGGMVEFGPNGFLYIAMGDGGAGGDPENRGQNANALLGKILKIDVDRGDPYATPADNPFASGGGHPEIYAYGLRNPWRFSFDRQTSELWAADVGQNDWEEVNVVRRGGNYGWRIMEGSHCFSPRDGCRRAGLEAPVTEYRHEGGRCSITGGYVYRGERIAALRGTYIYGDYCSGEIFGFRNGTQRILLSTDRQISSFGQDQAGELYVVGHGGTIERIIAPPGEAPK